MCVPTSYLYLLNNKNINCILFYITIVDIIENNVFFLKITYKYYLISSCQFEKEMLIHYC